ncbi:MAG: PfkB family carbohydrate kinase [Lentisphaeria bacterium]|nr:MAG: PfkB family carbohydrate kinase [Lentisphaeria bacterium]
MRDAPSPNSPLSASTPRQFRKTNSRPAKSASPSIHTGNRPTPSRKKSAWDQIRWTPALAELAPTFDAVCFGTRAEKRFGETIRTFLRHTREDALRVFDLNLRAPFYNREVVLETLQLANILKLNDEELPILAGFFGVKPEEVIPRLLAGNIELVALSLGPEGAELHRRGECSRAPAGELEKMVDSVGAGDSFTATLIAGLLRGLPLDRINRHGNRVASYVCSQHGATPALPDSLKEF